MEIKTTARGAARYITMKGWGSRFSAVRYPASMLPNCIWLPSGKVATLRGTDYVVSNQWGTFTMATAVAA